MGVFQHAKEMCYLFLKRAFVKITQKGRLIWKSRVRGIWWEIGWL